MTFSGLLFMMSERQFVTMNRASGGFDLRVYANLISARIFSAHSRMNEYIMDNKEKTKLKETIEKKLIAIKEDIAAYELLTKPVSPDNAIGRLTRMEAINSKSINEAALMKARDTRSQLERALAKIDAADFGLCRECDEPIPSARLMILPETDLCVQCAENMSG